MFGYKTEAWFPIACKRCVLPTPVFPKIKNGLYATPSLFTTAFAAAQTYSLCGDIINSLKEYLLFKLLFLSILSKESCVSKAVGVFFFNKFLLLWFV